MSSFDYLIQGVELTDTRWAQTPGAPAPGVWHLLPGTSVLPSFPGVRATTFQRPGQQGESQVQHAPLEPRTETLVVRFLPLCTDPQQPEYLTQGFNWHDRMRFLEWNINQFLWRTRLGATASGGLVTLGRRSINGEHFLGRAQTGGYQECVGRVISSSEPEVHPDALYADYTLLFRNPLGSWYTTWAYSQAHCPAGQRTAIEVPMGTAAVPDARIAFTATAAGTRFLNDMGIGFEVPRQTSRWTVVDTGKRKGRTDLSSPSWDANLDNPSLVAEHGRPLGSALLVQPGISGRGDQVGQIIVEPKDDMDVRIALRPRWF